MEVAESGSSSEGTQSLDIEQTGQLSDFEKEVLEELRKADKQRQAAARKDNQRGQAETVWESPELAEDGLEDDIIEKNPTLEKLDTTDQGEELEEISSSKDQTSGDDLEELEEEEPLTAEEPAADAVEAEIAKLPPQRRQLLKKIGQGLATGVRHWAQNLDFRGKDRWWQAGAAGGVIEGALFQTLVPLPGGGYVRAGLNLGLAQGVYGAARLSRTLAIYRANREYARKDLTDEQVAKEFEERKQSIDLTYKSWGAKARTFFLGLSAGSTYASVAGLATTLGPELLKSMDIKFPVINLTGGQPAENIPTASTNEAVAATSTPTATATSYPERTPLPTQAPTPAPTPATEIPKPLPGSPVAATVPVTPELISPNMAQVDAAYQALEQNHADILGEAAKQIPGIPADKASEYLHEQAAAAVGEKLPLAREAALDALKAQGYSTAEIPKDVFDNMVAAAREEMQKKVNQSFFEAAAGAISTDQVVADGTLIFKQSLISSHDQLVEATGEALKESLAANAAIQQAITQTLEAGHTIEPAFVHEVVAAKGTTVGQLLVDNNLNITWTAADAEVLGAHVAANWDTLTETWGDIGAAHGWPADHYFPFNLSELDQIIDAAKGGDRLALQKLKDALFWIKAGESFKVLNNRAVLEVVKTLAEMKK